MKLIQVLFLLCLFSACSKNEDSKPTKENFVDFKWNGKEFYHKTDPGNYKLEIRGHYSEEINKIGISIQLLNIATSHPTPVYNIGFLIENVEEGRHELRNAIVEKWDVICGRYVINHDLFSNLRITKLDLENNLIEGVFSYTTYNKCDKYDTIEISFGEFKVYNLTGI
jgi:hypothetical protein